jgi:predicted AAA+ superfamily ATPase
MFDRWFAGPFAARLTRPYVHILFGARQTGKSTLAGALLPAECLRINFTDPAERSLHLSRPGEFAAICRDLPKRRGPHFVFVDEAQAVPSVFDSVQSLYDSDKSRWRFVLCGSSARKLRVTGANLLPGRSFLHRLFPLVIGEHPAKPTAVTARPPVVPLAWKSPPPEHQFPAWGLEERLAYGSLPGIVAARELDRQELLKAFVSIHLEEEIRREALVRDWGAFVRFLQFAAVASGQALNFASISQEVGVSQPTVKSYFQLLEDMFIGFRVSAYTKSRRKGLLNTPRFLFFDLGVRNAASGVTPSIDVVRVNPGPLFEQWVGIELWKRLQYLGDGRLCYQRTRDGAEVDFIVERGNTLIPIEAKWTEHPTLRDARHLLSFIEENAPRASKGYVVCRCRRPLQLHEKITALPWQEL